MPLLSGSVLFIVGHPIVMLTSSESELQTGFVERKKVRSLALSGPSQLSALELELVPSDWFGAVVFRGSWFFEG